MGTTARAPGGFRTAERERVEIPDPLGLGSVTTEPRGEYPIGTRRISQVGYITVKQLVDGRSVWEQEARLVLERHLGRRLANNEEARHKAGARRYDNRLEKLELWRNGRPAKLPRPRRKRTNWKALYLEAADVLTLLLPYAEQAGHSLDDDTLAAVKRVLKKQP